MKIDIISKNIRVSDYLEDLIEKKFNKLDRFFANGTEAQVKLSVEKNRQICEASILYNHGTWLRAKEVSGDIYASVDGVVEKLEKQILHHRTKLEKRHRSAGHPDIIPTADYEEELGREIVRTKSFSVKPMDVEEASMQMDLLDHNFFVFRNAENDEINVLYLRDDGNLGLIQPTID